MSASTTISVEADDPDEAIDKACSDVYVSLCHQCARDLDLGGEWEPNVVTDDATGDVVWEDRC